MSDTTIPANTRVRYTDGHTDEIMVTMFQRTAAETYGKAHGWGSLMEAAVKFNAAVLQLGDIGIQFNGAAAFRLGAAACDFRLNGAAGTVRRDTAVTARGAADV